MKSWNEIRKAATAFSKRWKTTYDEKSQAQSFLKEFFDLFGVDTVTQATFDWRELLTTDCTDYTDGRDGCPQPSALPNAMTGFTGLKNESATLTQRTQSSQNDTKSLRSSADSAFSASAHAGINPVNPVNPVQEKISAAAQEILDIRQRYLVADASCSLATLYDPLTMPPELVKAHAKLDALVDKAYGRTFANDAERVAHLFNLYAEAVKPAS